MAAAQHPAPIRLLNSSADVDKLTGEPGQGWTRLECVTKKAYGCGERGQEAVEGLTLYLRTGGDPLDLSSSLTIRLTDDAFRRFDSELELLRQRKYPDHWEIAPERLTGANVLTTDQQLIVIKLSFFLPCPNYCHIFYFLVYDKINASLSLIKPMPAAYRGAYQIPVCVRRRHSADGADYYELLFTARKLVVNTPWESDDAHVLCVCSTGTRANTAPDGSDLWQIMRQRFPPKSKIRNLAALTFSFQGKAFWADLSRGLMYCELSSGRTAVDFFLVDLPLECPRDDGKMPGDYLNKGSRTMGCVGNSIWFVCIDRHMSKADDLVMIWSLKNLEDLWTLEHVIPTKELWGLDSFKEARLPEGALAYPVLTADGALCVLLCAHHRSGDPVVDYFCSFDVRNKRLLWHGRVQDYEIANPVILPSIFFPKQRVSLKRKVHQHLPAAGNNLID